MNAALEHNFEYHRPDGIKTGLIHRGIRRRAKDLAKFVDEHLPAAAGREKAIALTNIETAMMFACAGVTRHPLDESAETDQAATGAMP